MDNGCRYRIEQLSIEVRCCVVRGEPNNRNPLQSESTETTNDRCIATVKACRTGAVGVRVCTHLNPGVSVPYVFEKADFVVTGCQPELRRLEEIDDID